MLPFRSTFKQSHFLAFRQSAAGSPPRTAAGKMRPDLLVAAGEQEDLRPIFTSAYQLGAMATPGAAYAIRSIQYPVDHPPEEFVRMSIRTARFCSWRAHPNHSRLSSSCPPATITHHAT